MRDLIPFSMFDSAYEMELEGVTGYRDINRSIVLRERIKIEKPLNSKIGVDIGNEIISDIGCDIMMPHRRHRRPRRRIGVPKGMLRHLTLRILKKIPMSGSEIMDEIEYYTDWRPSPGSIYPLLANLQKEKLIEHHPDEDPSLKRFKLTENGLKELEEYKKHDDQFRNRQKSIRKIYWMLHREMPEDLYGSFAALLDTVEVTYKKASASPEVAGRFKEILGQAAKQLSEIGA